MKVYLHADDLASTEAVTQAILDRWKRGYLDGFSVMANGEAAETTRSTLAAFGERPARIVAHLNLSEGPSISPPEQVPLLVDRCGRLRHGFASLVLTWLAGPPAVRRALLDQVEAEWRAQVLRVREMVAPRPLNGVDGHVHVHMLPFLFPIAARLARENGIAEIRISKEPFFLAEGVRDLLLQSVLINLLKHMVLRVCARSANEIARTAGLICTSFVIGVLYSGRMTAAAALAGLAAARRAGAQSVEVMFHVGRAGEEERSRWGDRPGFADFNCSPRRDQEFGELASLHTRLIDCGARVANSQLAQSRDALLPGEGGNRDA